MSDAISCSAWSASCSWPSRPSGLGGKNPWWSLYQVREAIEAQLDPDMGPRERTRCLAKALRRAIDWALRRIGSTPAQRMQWPRAPER